MLRAILAFSAVAVLVAGCGEESGSNLPPGVTRQLPGLGPVADAAAANQRVLAQYLGLAAGRQDTGADGPNGADVIGEGDDDPLADVYAVPGGLLAAGTPIASAEPNSPAWRLPEPHFVYWVDPMPGADLGHTCFLVYLAADDGAMIEQRVEFDPLVDGARPLEFDAAKADGRLYRHALWLRTDDILLAEPAPPGRAGRALAAGTAVRTVIIAGTAEARRQNDINAARNFATGPLGQTDADITVVQDQEGDRLTENDVKAAIRTAAEGLGENDKLLVILSSHGSELSFTVGDEFITWLGFALFLATEVKVEHVNLMLGPCHSGAAVPQFDEMASLSDSRVQLLTSTDSAHPAWAPGGVNVPLSLYYEKINQQLEQANGDGTLTIDEIESAFGAVDLTADEANQRYLAVYEQNQSLLGAGIEGLLGLFGSGWKDDFLQDDGENDDVRPHGDPKNHVVDGRPTGGPQPIAEVEPNNTCATGTPLDTQLSATGSLTTGDQDHYRYELGPGAWKLRVTGNLGLYLEVDDQRPPATGSGQLEFNLSAKSGICAGVFGGLGRYDLTIAPR